MSPLNWPSKDPDEVLDYKLDWSARLDGDTIASSEWTVPPELEGSREARTDTSTTIWLGGGLNGRTHLVANRITTAAGRVMDQTVRIVTLAR